MRDVAEMYGYSPNRAGFITCPFHGGDNTPSLKVYSEVGRGFYCHACGAGSSVIDFAMKLFDLSFSQAVVRLDNDFGLNLMNRKPDKKAVNEWQIKRAKEQAEVEAYRAAYDAKCREFRELRNLPRPEQDSPLWGEYAASLGRLDYLEYWFEVNHWR